MNRTAVAAPAKPPTDACNWLPMKATASSPRDMSLLCELPCVQHFDMKVTGAWVTIHRCEGHKLTEEFVSKLRQGPLK